MKILVTGGSGFIGSAFIRYVIGSHDDELTFPLKKLSLKTSNPV